MRQVAGLIGTYVVGITSDAHQGFNIEETSIEVCDAADQIGINRGNALGDVIQFGVDHLLVLAQLLNLLAELDDGRVIRTLFGATAVDRKFPASTGSTLPTASVAGRGGPPTGGAPAPYRKLVKLVIAVPPCNHLVLLLRLP
jgi:hypothetical protein